jgi:hypothetical protein
VFTPSKSLLSLDREQGSPSQHSSTGNFHNHGDVARAYLPSVPAVSGPITQPETSDSFPRTAFLIIGLVLLVAINILFIVDIELTLRRNKGDQNGDDAWGFGQVLALLLIIPLRDAWGALQDI